VALAVVLGPVDQTLDALSKASLEPILLAFACLPLVQFLRAWRFRCMLFPGLRPPNFVMMRIAVLVVFFNGILPFRIGELSFPLLAKREFGLDIGHSLGLLVAVRAYDLVALLSLGCLCIVVLDQPGYLVGTAISLGLCLLGLIVLARFIVPRIGERADRVLSLRWVGSALAAFLRGFAEISGNERYLAFVGLTFAIWILQFVVCYLVLISIAGNIGYWGFWQGSLAGAGAYLSFVLPVNGLAGLGPMQAGWVLVLGQFGYAMSASIGSGLLLNGIYVLGAAGLAGIVTMLGFLGWSSPSKSNVSPGKR
jgi:hypothetical protein